jgi:signal transduction histidine kinase
MKAAPTLRRESVLQRPLALSDVLEPASFQELVRGFAELYKIGVKVFDHKGDKLADVKIGNGDFCGHIFSFPEGRRCCTATVARVKDGPLAPTHGAVPPAQPDGPVGLIAVPCFTGLRYLVLPIRFEGDVLGRAIFGPFTPDDLKELPATLTSIAPELDVGVAWRHLEKVRRAPEGTVARVMAHFAQILGSLIAAGQRSHLTAQLHIETTLESHKDLEAQHRKLEDAFGRLRELDRLKSSFLATVSHELRTPLTSIIGYSEMLAEGLAGPLQPLQGEYVRTIMEKGETLLSLISSILDISQIEAGKVRLVFSPTDPSELVLQAVSSLKPQAQKKGVGLEVQAPSFTRRPVADREKLRQVVVNLLANAVKFTPSGGRVRVQLSQPGAHPGLEGEGFRIAVEDTGLGIAPDQLEKIFQSFYQVDSSSTREFGGAGLGLAIVRSYVEGHGGRVGVTSQAGKGSCFSVVLPMLPAAATQSQVTPPGLDPTPDRF